MDEIKAKQQVVEKIQESGKILVTVSDDPSVDALSAALGLAMILDKQSKYATAIFSGHTPPAIAFLEPEKTFDDTTDSLRDFIIALNKEKADHLSYKVVGDLVKISITPYKTTINEDDLQFSQGNYNVELVIALGVDNKNSLDGALANHGQILHDATIITMTAGDQTSDLGGIDWHDSNSSSLSEMIAGLAEALKDDKKKPLLDETIATALLTGIVAETDRFSNEHTTSKAMTVAAALMAAGADQQLIANELQNSNIGPNLEGEAEVDDDATSGGPNATSSGSDTKSDKSDTTGGAEGVMSIQRDGLDIKHGGETLAELDKRVRKKDVPAQEAPQPEKTQPDTPQPEAPHPVYSPPRDEVAEPTFSSSLSATVEQASADNRAEQENEHNKTILSHAYLSEPAASPTPTIQPPESENGIAGFPGTPPVAPGSVGVNDVEAIIPTGAPQAAYAFDDDQAQSQVPTGTLEAPQASQPASLSQVPASQAPTPADLGLPLPPPLPDFSQGITPPPAIPLPPSQSQPAILGDILAAEPQPQPITQPVSQPTPQPIPPPAPTNESTTPASTANPGQFQIPGQ